MNSLEAGKEATQSRGINKQDDDEGNTGIEPKYIQEYDEVMGVQEGAKKRLEIHDFLK